MGENRLLDDVYDKNKDGKPHSFILYRSQDKSHEFNNGQIYYPIVCVHANQKLTNLILALFWNIPVAVRSFGTSRTALEPIRLLDLLLNYFRLGSQMI